MWELVCFDFQNMTQAGLHHLAERAENLIRDVEVCIVVCYVRSLQ